MNELIKILTREENVRMQYEILLMLLAFAVPALKIKSRKKLAAAWALAAAVFAWLHRILLPAVVSGLYLYMIAGILAVLLYLDPKAFLRPAAAVKKALSPYLEQPAVLYALIPLLILMIQLCRINIAIDYDSLRYGLRSDVLLTGGHGFRGFFENTGLVNLVYSYPKGFEVLTRPLYFGHTWGYILCVNFWVLAVIWLMADLITREITGNVKAGIFTACLLSMVPGISNMALTAKSDLMTLLCQLIFLYCCVRYVNADAAPKGKDHALCGRLTGCGLAALAASYALKPTALVFSSLLGLTALIMLLRYEKQQGGRLLFSSAGCRVLIPVLLFTLLMTARTFLITGMPFTSIFTGVFERLGMTLHYPFRVQQASSKAPLALTDTVRFYLGRLFGFLFCPVGEDMLHVQMAWGGLAFTLVLIAGLLGIRKVPEQMSELNRLQEVGTPRAADPERKGRTLSKAGFLLTAAASAVTGAVSLLTLYFLYQIDGNYYGLLYALVIITGSSVISVRAAYEVSPLGKNLPKRFSQKMDRAMIMLSAVMIWFTAFTGWAGPVGFTPVDPVNRGYYNHEVEFGISDPMHWDRHTRVVAFASEPDCYLLKGRVESWVDIDGTGGNVYLTDTKLNIFKEYLSFADIDYIYADLRFLHDREDERHKRADTLFTYMLEDGDFESVVLAENTSSQIFAKIDKERMAEDWEVPLSEEKQERTAMQCAWYESIGGYRQP